jgi:hypothetical protein
MLNLTNNFMKRKFEHLFVVLIIIFFAVCPLMLKAQSQIVPNWKINPDKELNPNTKWLRDAKYGLFSHYLVHMPSAPVPEDMAGEKWNKKVNSFQVKKFGNQLTKLKAPYFFITIGQGGGYFCSPNSAYERLFGSSEGKLSERDLIAELAMELSFRGIRMCVYLTGRVIREPETQGSWLQVITEWSERWGTLVSAWWIDGGANLNTAVYQAFTNAYKAGNPDALVAYNTRPVGMNRDQLMPATEYEDYLAGECDYFLPTCGIRVFDGKEYYLGPNISGDQLHFLNFLGAWWGTGEPRFSNEMAISWTKHINDHGGTVSWDVPLSDTGEIAENYYRQIVTLSKQINNISSLLVR